MIEQDRASFTSSSHIPMISFAHPDDFNLTTEAMTEQHDAAIDQPFLNPDWIQWTTQLLDSYAAFVDSELISRSEPAADARRLYDAPFVVVSHGTQADPLLNYGNAAALQLWQLPLEKFLGTPSRKTAEPVHRDERAELLRRTRQHGFIDDYSGVRISATGTRFRIHRATVWNVVDDQQQHIGQAAAFSEWTALPDGS